VEEVRTLVTHVVQGERWGTSIGKVLRVYSETLRRQRRQAAEKKAATAPVKMLLPLGVFIFPALLIVIMGPIALNVMTLFQQH
jgi:tight adherence protein C